jgi:8-oxo-dGTP pyrophosphatase MutT (NUDIX family)
VNEQPANPLIEFTGELRTSIQRNLAAHSLRTVEANGMRRAAVAFVVVDSELHSDLDDPFSVSDEELESNPLAAAGSGGPMHGVAGGAAFVLCRRASRMNSHAAQWALPGGRIDGDETPEQAALRELDEELGVRLQTDSVLGRLDDYPTRSGYVITPVIVWGGADLVMQPSPDEVAGAYRVGLHHLRRADSPRYIEIPESPRPVVQIPLADTLIHAPTGAVLLQFRWVAIDGRPNERVDHLEQPVFAWR